MECPYCREEIADGAKKCRYCNEFLDKDADTHPSLLGQIDQVSNILTDYVKKLIIWLFVALIAYLIYDNSQKPSSKNTEEEKVEEKDKRFQPNDMTGTGSAGSFDATGTGSAGSSDQ